ncbi:MAG TPA: hypothetical protein VEW71_06880 [Allosphingosinicella sp.]|nr:hypothetical protein [Allosphingosinicella sp.]
MAEPLKVVEVAANKWWVDTGIDVAPGDALRFEASGIWWDASYEAGPDGVDIPSLRNWGFLRRVRRAEWAELAGSVGRLGGFPIGAGATRRFSSGGRLRLFFNDAFGFYHNNRGSVSVSIHRD